MGVMAHILQLLGEHTLVTFHSLVEDGMALVEEGHKCQLAQLVEGHSLQLLAQLKAGHSLHLWDQLKVDHILQSEVHYTLVKEEAEEVVGVHVFWVLVVVEDGA